ncbi:hypothetical protein, partial [Nocardiopsis kunsanensis]|uniref:hypothetical protein n=1 Tax=Nocardiopsis kunsanensis TaxID=141693 RepID=UPI0009FD7924
RLRAAAAFADHLISRADDLATAWLDTRSLRSCLVDAAAWLGRTWRTHLHHAHVRRYGPGRGLLVVITNRTTDTDKEGPRER